MYSPLVSVIVPVYNVEKYLPECLDSILSQTYKNLEVLCVNDGSTDNSEDILKKYQQKDSRIKIITQPNQGLSGARNTAMKFVTGELVTFVDSDDWIDSDTIEKSYKFFKDSDIDFLCFGSARYFEKNGTSRNYYKYNKNEIRNVGSWVTSLCVTTWGKIYRTKFLFENNLNFPIGLFYEDNFFFWGCVSFAKKIGVLENVFYHYRIHDDSIMGRSKSKSKGMAIHVIYGLEKIHNLWERNGFLNVIPGLFESVFEESIKSGFRYLHEEDNREFIDKTRFCVQTWNLRLMKFTLAYDLVKGNSISPTKYRWARSIRKRITHFKNLLKFGN